MIARKVKGKGFRLSR